LGHFWNWDRFRSNYRCWGFRNRRCWGWGYGCFRKSCAYRSRWFKRGYRSSVRADSGSSGRRNVRAITTNPVYHLISVFLELFWFHPRLHKVIDQDINDLIHPVRG